MNMIALRRTTRSAWLIGAGFAVVAIVIQVLSAGQATSEAMAELSRNLVVSTTIGFVVGATHTAAVMFLVAGSLLTIYLRFADPAPVADFDPAEDDTEVLS